jgi:hypothetical protein
LARNKNLQALCLFVLLELFFWLFVWVGDATLAMYLCAIANRYGSDLEQAFREKEEVNKTRVWRVLGKNEKTVV